MLYTRDFGTTESLTLIRHTGAYTNVAHITGLDNIVQSLHLPFACEHPTLRNYPHPVTHRLFDGRLWIEPVTWSRGPAVSLKQLQRQNGHQHTQQYVNVIQLQPSETLLDRVKDMLRTDP